MHKLKVLTAMFLLCSGCGAVHIGPECQNLYSATRFGSPVSESRIDQLRQSGSEDCARYLEERGGKYDPDVTG